MIQKIPYWGKRYTIDSVEIQYIDSIFVGSIKLTFSHNEETHTCILSKNEYAALAEQMIKTNIGVKDNEKFSHF